MSDRVEFEKRNAVPEKAIWSENKQGYYWSNYPTVAHLFNDKWEVWQEALEYARANGTTVPMTRIAESKVRQMGGDVCGVLVRKDGRLAAVGEHGRVQWLRGGQGAEPDWSDSKTLESEGWKNPLLSKNDRLQIADGAVAWRDEVIKNLRSRATQPAQQESVQRGIDVAIDMLEDYASALGNGDLDGAGHSTTQSIYEVITLLSTPQPEGDVWVKCSERLPEQLNREYLVRVNSQIHSRPRMFVAEYNEYGFDRSKVTHWMPLPQPPEEAIDRMVGECRSDNR